jgi:hypothetical protein
MSDVLDEKALELTEARLTATATAVANYFGCGDSSCAFVTPHGMATNGGCRCLKDGPVTVAQARTVRAMWAWIKKAPALIATVLAQQARIAELEAEVQRLKVARRVDGEFSG